MTTLGHCTNRLISRESIQIDGQFIFDCDDYNYEKNQISINLQNITDSVWSLGGEIKFVIKIYSPSFVSACCSVGVCFDVAKKYHYVIDMFNGHSSYWKFESQTVTV